MHLLKVSRPLLLGSVLMAATSSGGASGRAVEIAIKDRANANASLAASGRFAALVWSVSTKEGATDIHVATSRDGGRTFAAPTRVNRAAGEASASGEQPPRVALIPNAGGDPSIAVVWTARGAAGTRLLSARSDDGGKSFTASAPVPGSEASGNRGWASIATNGEGAVVALWLDHRELATGKSGAAAMSHAQHLHEAAAAQQTDGVARAQLSKLFFSRLGSPDSARALTGGVCYCCKTTIAAGRDGAVYAAWRHVYPGNIRDVAFSMSADGGRTFTPPVRVSEDQWVLDGCPENGPAVAVDASNRIHVVWPTLVSDATAASEPTLALFYATSADGRRFTPRQRIPTEGVPRHPQIAAGPHGDFVVVWDEQAGGTRHVALARGSVDSGGAARFARQGIDDAGYTVYPVVAAAGDDTIVAWTSGLAGRSVVRAERLEDRPPATPAIHHR